MGEILISVHFPKAGGTSFGRALVEALGAERVILDYQDNPADPLAPPHLDPEGWARMRPRDLGQAKAVHGHFHPGKYLALAGDLHFVTCLRHPVENLLSIHRFWTRLPSVGNGLHDYFLKHRLDPVRLSELPLLRHLMSRTYFGGFPMERFALIGDAANWEGYRDRVSSLIGAAIPPCRINITPKEDAPGIGAAEYAAIERNLAEDIDFYQTWRNRGLGG